LQVVDRPLAEFCNTIRGKANFTSSRQLVTHNRHGVSSRDGNRTSTLAPRALCESSHCAGVRDIAVQLYQRGQLSKSLSIILTHTFSGTLRFAERKTLLIRNTHEAEDGHAFDRVTGLCAHRILSKKKYQDEGKPRREKQPSE
jgi:hypothetical protein